MIDNRNRNKFPIAKQSEIEKIKEMVENAEIE